MLEGWKVHDCRLSECVFFLWKQFVVVVKTIIQRRPIVKSLITSLQLFIINRLEIQNKLKHAATS